MAKKRNRALRALARDILRDELHALLRDVTYRLDVLYSAAMGGGRIGSRDLNLAAHQLDGFAVTDNSPSSGYIAWTDCNIVYKGTNYAIANGNTNKKYVYWSLASTPTTFKTSDTKPTLSDDDVLVFINDGGAHQTVLGSGRMTSGAAILDGTVDSAAVGSGAITEAKIAALAISEAKLASGAVTTGKLGAGAVDATALASSAVTSAKIASGAVGTTAIASSAVTAAQIASGAVGNGQLSNNAVTTSKIASGAVGTTQLAGTSVTSDKIASGAVGTSQIAAGAITGTLIGAGAVATDKLNTALHMLF